MRAILFRKLVIDGVNYYQLYDEVEDFEKRDDFNSFADYENRDTKDNFYIDANSNIELEEPSFLNIYTDSNDGLKVLSDIEEFMKVFNAFKDKFNIDIHEIKSIDEIVNEVKKKVLFQEEATFDLVEQIYLNQSIMESDLPVELKLKLKNNILFHGPFGSGKKSIIDVVEKNIDIPYADVTITGELKDNLEDIIKQLLDRSSNNDEVASHGIVFLRDNFLRLADIFHENAYQVPSFFTSQKVITYGDKKIDFRTLTFVVLLDERIELDFDEDDIRSIQDMTDCTCSVETRRLSDKEKYLVLLSKNGRIRHYEKFLKQYDKKMVIDEVSLRKIIRACSSIDPGMNVLNSVIDAIMKSSLLGGINDVYIDKTCANLFIPAITSISLKEKEDYNIKPKKEEIFDEGLKDVYESVIKTVVGQDRQVKNILYTILENRRMANKDELDNPKKYIKNILIRGESGGGKTLIVETISKILNIPMFIADATQYTEEGYVGSSVTDMLINLYHAADDDLEKAERGILVIDEIDKKANGSNDRDISRGAVLDGLLKIVEGAVIPINVGNRMQEEIVMFDTSRLTVICQGAFEGIEKCRDNRLGKRKVGFDNGISKDIDKSITDEDYVSYGMKKQLMARLPVMVELNKNTKESLISIMKNSDASALKIEKYILEDRGIEVEYTESFYEALAKDALRMNIGARGISKALERVLSNIHVEEIQSSKVSKIIFDGDVVENPDKIVLIPCDKQKVKTIK